ncbi:MAG TPA: dihydropteroate synthase [Burkholderiales bacterium]|nr:dihydropteroate synthase [Burkholderiales bacterium]
MIFLCGRFKLDLSRPLIMGIVNVTPDSFSDGGLHATTEAAVAHGLRLIEEGADMLDIGGESTRPGSLPISLDEELKRVLPVLEALKHVNVPLSADTQKPEVMREALRVGASMINDVNALAVAGALQAVAKSDAAVCLMHKQGEPLTMQVNPQYHDVVAQIKAFLGSRIEAALAAGIARERIVIDPGFGFGKTVGHNLVLLRNLEQFRELGVPLLVGLSRKSVLGKIASREIGERIYSSTAAALIAVMKGAKIVRVHDVGATRDTLAVYNALNAEQY